MSKLNELFSKAANNLPQSLISNEGELVLVPNSVNKFVSYIDQDEPTEAAINFNNLTLTEVRGIKQLKKNSDTDWMFILELTIAAPGARLGQVDDNDVFAEFDFYSQAEALANQIPMIYGQHMRVDTGQFEALRSLCRDHQWTPLSIGQGTDSPSKDRREVIFHLAAPTKHHSFSDQVAERATTGLPVNKLFINPSTDPEYIGFKDFASAMVKNFMSVIADNASADPEIQKRSKTLVSSLTGFNNWTTADGANKRSPIRASLPKLEVNGELFSFWSDVTNA